MTLKRLYDFLNTFESMKLVHDTSYSAEFTCFHRRKVKSRIRLNRRKNLLEFLESEKVLFSIELEKVSTVRFLEWKREFTVFGLKGEIAYQYIL